MENRSVFDCQSAIESEFNEPLRAVIAGFIPLGMTRVEVAETLEVNPRSLRTFCERSDIHFPLRSTGRNERIRETRRTHGRARMLELGGRRQCLTAWAEEYRLNVKTLHKRLRTRTLADALR